MPPPMSMCSRRMPSAASRSTSAIAFRAASRCGASSVICEPMCRSMPRRVMCAHRRAPGGTAPGRRRMAMPNLFSLSPVEMYGCVPGSTSGLTRRAYRRAHAHALRQTVQMFEFARRFDVEAVDRERERLLHFGVALADPGEDDFARIAAGCYDARELAAGDDVEAAAQTREEVEHSQGSNWPSLRSRPGAASPQTPRRTLGRRLRAPHASRRSRASRSAPRSRQAARLRRRGAPSRYANSVTPYALRERRSARRGMVSLKRAAKAAERLSHRVRQALPEAVARGP